MISKTISVIGLGYIGLPTAAAFASRKVKVIGVDIDERAVRTINAGGIHIAEPELDMVVQAAVASGTLRATTLPEPADVFLIAVPTPFKGDHEPDLQYVEAAGRSIAPVLQRGNLVILESTSPVGTTERLVAWLAEARPDLTFPHQAGEGSDIRVAYCPERVLPGHVMRELVENDRVIGGMTRRCSLAAQALYKIFAAGECFLTDARTAEMCKLAENAFRDVNIAFANELSLICDRQGIDVWELIRLANRHPRVDILRPGPGVGGHCIAVDPWFIVHSAPHEARLIRTARQVNDARPHWVVGKVDEAVQAHLAAHPGAPPEGVRIACLGLTFKPDVDDLRQSPAMDITRRLGERYPGRVLAVEPHIDAIPAVLAERGVPLVSLDEALDNADVVVLLVDHRAFRACERERLDGCVVVDTRGVWPAEVPSLATVEEAAPPEGAAAGAGDPRYGAATG